MNGPTRRLAGAVFAAFGVLLAALTWYQVVGADRYRDDPRNARLSLSLIGKERGLIVAADGTVLAVSEPDPQEPQAYRRTYPAGPAFTHLVGYSSRLVGSTGLEEAFDDRLRSRRDVTISDIVAALLGRDLRPLSLQLTIDPAVQEAAYAALDGQRGAVVAIDPATGAVLAYVSSPSYDANAFLEADAVAARQAVLDDPLEPIRDRATAELYSPGSAFKVVVTAAALELGVAGPETPFPDPIVFPLPGSTAGISNFDGRTCAGSESVILQTAFVRSCNTTFADLAIQVGAEEIDAMASSLGFNRAVDFPWEPAGSTFPGEELASDPAALAQSGIGQRDVRATPLVMALAAAAVANEGTLMQPYLVRQVFDADGATVESSEPRELGRAMSPATAAVLAQLMERVVTEGTGRRAAVPGVRVAGKTGTAERPDGPPHAWFIGFAPVEAPTIAVAVLVEEGGNAGESGTGGSVAAPIAAAVIRAYLSAG